MIPGKIVSFLDRANVSHAGTRDRNLVPHGHRVSGWRLNHDGSTLTVLLPDGARPHLIESLEDNGQFSVTIEEYPAHETYQFKGRYVRHRRVDGDDIDVANRVRERFVSSVIQLFGEAAAVPLRAFSQRPALAVEFLVDEIYVQTPGPGAGARLFPAAEA
ncbi:MAG TPA: hypothetical protein VFV95_16945 [Vicinamibacterales bacterium]|nr:hypothetical protein [Vicinamibacterales bacterium]